MYKGLATVGAMSQFHTTVNGWSDIAQHIFIAPGRHHLNSRSIWAFHLPVLKDFNGNSTHGPFMFEMMGDFDMGKDPSDGARERNCYRCDRPRATAFWTARGSVSFAQPDDEREDLPSFSQSSVIMCKIKLCRRRFNELTAQPAEAAEVEEN